MDRGSVHLVHIHVDSIIIDMLGPLERMAMRLVNKHMSSKVSLACKLDFNDVLNILENVEYRRVFLVCVSRRFMFLDAYNRCNMIHNIVCTLDDVDVYNWANQTVQHRRFGATITCCIIKELCMLSKDLNLFRAIIVPDALYNGDFNRRNDIFWRLMNILKPHQLYILPWLVDMGFVNFGVMHIPYNIKSSAIMKHNASYVFQQKYFRNELWDSWIYIAVVFEPWDVDMAMFLIKLIDRVPVSICTHLDEYSEKLKNERRALHIKLHPMCGCDVSSKRPRLDE